jgi:hypothetical protein
MWSVYICCVYTTMDSSSISEKDSYGRIYIDSRRADINGVMPDISIIILLRNYFWIQHEDKYGCKLKYLMYRLSKRSIVLSYII